MKKYRCIIYKPFKGVFLNLGFMVFEAENDQKAEEYIDWRFAQKVKTVFGQL